MELQKHVRQAPLRWPTRRGCQAGGGHTAGRGSHQLPRAVVRPQPAQQLPWRVHLSMGSQGAHPVKELEAVCMLTVQGLGLGLKTLGGYSRAFRLRLGQLQAGLRGGTDRREGFSHFSGIVQPQQQPACAHQASEVMTNHGPPLEGCIVSLHLPGPAL